MNQAGFKKLVSGESAGPIAVALRFLLNVAAAFYGLGIALRNRLYDKELSKSYAVIPAGLVTSDRTQAAVPVISVGNITVGGTGKTPMVIWLCNFLQDKGVNCAILTRGYKAVRPDKSDELVVLIRNCPNAALLVNPNRLAGAIEAVKKHRAQVLIMDDGFQHRRLHRDIDIVTIDAMLPFGFAQDRPFGYNRMLPAGLLREPVTALKRTQAAVLTRCDLVSKDDLTKLEETIHGINPNMVVARTIHAPVCARTEGNKQIPLEQLKAKKVFAFCGIANPGAFFATIDRLGANLVGSKIYDDHHDYTARDANEIYRDAAQSKAEMLLTTEKDFDKIDPPVDNPAGLVLAYLAVKLQFVEGQDRISRLIEQSLAGKISGKRAV